MASITANVSNYLANKQAEQIDKEDSALWAELEELYNRKLWHQLTLKMTAAVNHPSLQHSDQLIKLYYNFISTFEMKINALALVEILSKVVTQYKDKREAVAFLEECEAKVKGNVHAVALLKVLAGQILLIDLNDLEGTKVRIEAVDKMVNDSDGVCTIHGRFYALASGYYRTLGKHAEYYHSALRYLGCVPLCIIPPEDQQDHAFYLGLAALLGEGVYNIGELLAHPVLDSLKNTRKAWVKDLLIAFNQGDIVKYELMRNIWRKIPDLVVKEADLRQKISLLCLMEMTFKRAANDRRLTFAEVAKETQLPIEDVEQLLMKAMAKGLVRGSIDQVDQVVVMTWVLPRVLDRTQISSMVIRLDGWCKDVNSMESLLETRAHEFLTL